MQLPNAEKDTFQKKILSWYKVHKRDLPWRKTRDPYAILISEVMLQQTQVLRVIPKYEAWLETFPTVQSLASAKTADVLRLWSGLGYNRRALNLQKAAKEIVQRKVSKEGFPRSIEELKKLPGIGEYTARAVACFAFDQQIAVVDTNVRKVILMKFQIINEKQIQEIADKILPRGRAYEWNQALMDYASAMPKKERILRQSQTKQSQFFGSNRYYRGKILKTLLLENVLSQQKLQQAIGLSDTLLFQQLLLDLIKEGFIVRSHGQLMLG